MAPSIFASEHERRNAQQRGFYRFLTWPFILFEMAVAASAAQAQKFVHVGEPDRPAEDTKDVGTAPSSDDQDPAEGGQSATEDENLAGPTPVPNAALQSPTRPEAPSGGELIEDAQGHDGASGSQPVSPSAASAGASGAGSGTSPSILTPNASVDDGADGLAGKGFGLGETFGLFQSPVFQTPNDLSVFHIGPTPAFAPPGTDVIEGVVSVLTTPLTTIVPTVAAGVLTASEETIDVAQSALAPLAANAGQTLMTAANSVTDAAHGVFEGVTSVTELVSSGVAPVVEGVLGAGEEQIDAAQTIIAAVATSTGLSILAEDEIDETQSVIATLASEAGATSAAAALPVTEAASVVSDGWNSETELVSSSGSLVFEDSRPPMVDALFDKNGYTDYGIEVGRAVDATHAHAAESTSETDTSYDAAPSLLPDTTIKSVADDLADQTHHAAGDGIL